MKRILFVLAVAMMAASCAPKEPAMPKVYMTTDISPEGLVKVYEALGVDYDGKVAVKISTGERGGHNFLKADLIAPLVQKVEGTIVECNVAYPGARYTTEEHWNTIKLHGFYDIAPCDIMDEEGEKAIPVKNGFHLKENVVGTHIDNYDSMLVLSHFKGHVFGGFGGALKNMSIGLASSRGKLLIHNAGAGDSFDTLFTTVQDHFLESMADACSSIIDHYGAENMVYINVANKISPDCDCSANPKDPVMADIGIFASLDPVAVDQACVDAIYNSDDEGRAEIIERMEGRHGIHVVEAAADLGLGSREYEFVNIDAR